MHVKQAANTITLTLEADEVARAIIEHCRREMGMLLPGDRICALSLIADGQSIRKLKVVVKQV